MLPTAGGATHRGTQSIKLRSNDATQRELEVRLELKLEFEFEHEFAMGIEFVLGIRLNCQPRRLRLRRRRASGLLFGAIYDLSAPIRGLRFCVCLCVKN